jgi:polyisoprenoid-binding protein YceI
MKKMFLALVILAFSQVAMAQSKFGTKTGKISFHSDSSMEKIEATNAQAACVIDPASSKVEFMALVQAFQFEKALMQEHFNENYMESTKFPKASFKGSIVDPSQVNFSTPGTYKCTVAGDLTIHGVAKPMKASAVITVKADGSLNTTCNFNVLCSDHNIVIPALVKDNISNNIEIKVNADLRAL